MITPSSVQVALAAGTAFKPVDNGGDEVGRHGQIDAGGRKFGLVRLAMGQHRRHVHIPHGGDVGGGEDALAGAARHRGAHARMLDQFLVRLELQQTARRSGFAAGAWRAGCRLGAVDRGRLLRRRCWLRSAASPPAADSARRRLACAVTLGDSAPGHRSGSACSAGDHRRRRQVDVVVGQRRGARRATPHRPARPAA